MEARKKVEKFAHVSSGFELTSLIPVELRLINSYYYMLIEFEKKLQKNHG